MYLGNGIHSFDQLNWLSMNRKGLWSFKEKAIEKTIELAFIATLEVDTLNTNYRIFFMA